MKAILYAVVDPPIWVLVAILLLVLLLLDRRVGRAQLTVLVVSSALSLSCVEVIFRLNDIGNFERAIWIEPIVHGQKYAYYPNGRLVYRYPSNPRGYFDQNDEVVGTINAGGFRGPWSGVEKPDGVYRVAFLGDSFTLGVGVKDQDTIEENFARSLEAMGKAVEALNFGVSATATGRQVRLLENYVLEFHPDAVVIVMFLNDTERAGTIDFLSTPRVLARLRRHSRFVHAVLSAVERPLLYRAMVLHYRHGYADSSPDWKRVRDALQRAKQLSCLHGFRLVVVLYPVLIDLQADRYPFMGIHHTIERACESMNIPFLDLLDTFLGQVDHDMWVHASDQHPNEIAQARAGARVAEFFLSQGWLPHQEEQTPPAVE